MLLILVLGGTSDSDSGRAEGVVNWVQIDLEPDDHSHMFDSEHMAHVRLTKQ